MAKKKKDPIGVFAWGAILILVSIWMMVSLQSLAAKVIGGGVVAILGISSIVDGIIQMKTGKKAKFGEFVWGGLLIIVGIWMIVGLETLAARMVGGGIVTILGIASVIRGILRIRKEK